MADQTVAIDASPRPEASSTVLQIAVLAALAATGTLATNILLPSLPQMAASLKVIERCGHLGHHHLPCGIRGRPARGRADFGPLRPPLAGLDRLCGVLCRQRLVRARDRSAEPADRPRDPGRRRLRHFRAVARDRPRHVLRRRAGARDGADHDRDGGSARLLAAARRRARSLLWLALRIRARCRLCRARRPRLRHACSAKPIMRRGRRSIRWRSPKTISA